MKVCMLSSVHRALDNRVFYREARTLVRAGHEVTLVAVHPRDEIRDGVRIVGLPEVSRWRRLSSSRDLERVARSSGADIFHFHDPELLVAAHRLGRAAGRPTVYDVHEAYPEFFMVKDYLPAVVRYPLAWAFRILEPSLAGLHDALVFADEATPAAFRRLRRPRIVLPNYPSDELVAAGGRALGSVVTRPPVLLYLGGVERNRGSRLMVEAFSMVRAGHPAARLVVVGHFMPPSLERELRRDAESHGVAESIEIIGRVPFAEVGRHLGQAAVGWVPWQPAAKNQKNVPTKLLEYMAFGLPVVASDLASTRPFVADDDTGRLVRAEDPEAHAAAILELLADRERAAAMGLRGRETVTSRFNWAAVEGRLLELYETLASSE